MAIQHFKSAKRLATSGTNYNEWKETNKVNADDNVIFALYVETTAALVIHAALRHAGSTNRLRTHEELQPDSIR